MDDAVLVQRAVGGDSDAFGALYARYATPLHDFLARMLGNPHDAADALQETFLTAGARLDQLQDPAKVRPWLYAIARRQAYRAGATRRRLEPIEDTAMIVDDTDPVDAVATDELATLIVDASRGLDERDRAVLHLHFRHGLDGDELAEAVGVTRGNAHVLVHRLRERLERSLGALLVARWGRRDCHDVDALLGGWDGRLSSPLRKRLARHIEECDVCAGTRNRHLRPSALLGALPLLAAPDDVGASILDEVELCSHVGEPWPPDLGGFPPPGEPGERRRRGPVAALVAVSVTLLVAAGLLLGQDSQAADGDSTTSTTAVLADSGPLDGSRPSITTTTGAAAATDSSTTTSRSATGESLGGQRADQPTTGSAPRTAPATFPPGTSRPPAGPGSGVTMPAPAPSSTATTPPPTSSPSTSTTTTTTSTPPSTTTTSTSTTTPSSTTTSPPTTSITVTTLPPRTTTTLAPPPVTGPRLRGAR